MRQRTALREVKGYKSAFKLSSFQVCRCAAETADGPSLEQELQACRARIRNGRKARLQDDMVEERRSNSNNRKDAHFADSIPCCMVQLASVSFPPMLTCGRTPTAGFQD